MASGDSNPLRKTDSPKRVTSRSSWISTSRCATRREIFRRTEFDPISTAAKGGIQQQFSPREEKLGPPVEESLTDLRLSPSATLLYLFGSRGFMLELRRRLGQLFRLRKLSNHRKQCLTGAAKAGAANVLQDGNQCRFGCASKMFLRAFF